MHEEEVEEDEFDQDPQQPSSRACSKKKRGKNGGAAGEKGAASGGGGKRQGKGKKQRVSVPSNGTLVNALLHRRPPLPPPSLPTSAQAPLFSSLSEDGEIAILVIALFFLLLPGFSILTQLSDVICFCFQHPSC